MSHWSSLPTARARRLGRQADGAAMSPAPSSTPSPAASPSVLFVRHMILVGDLGLGEGRHAGVAGKGCAQDEHGDRGTGSFAKPHAEIEQRMKTELLEQEAVTRFGRHVTGKGVVEGIG